MALAAPAMAAPAPVTINFDNGVAGQTVGNKYTPLGVTFTNAEFTTNYGLSGSSGALGIGDTNGNPNFISSANPIIGTFTSPVTSVTLRGIDVGVSGIRLEAYNAANVLLGFDQFFGTGLGSGTFHDLTVSFANIASFRAFQPGTTGDSNKTGDGIVFDNLSFTPSLAAAAPEPGTWALMIVGFGLAGVALRRRQKVTTRVAFA